MQVYMCGLIEQECGCKEAVECKWWDREGDRTREREKVNKIKLYKKCKEGEKGEYKVSKASHSVIEFWVCCK